MGKKSKEKRYFWLKLKEDWFSGTTEKYLKSLPAGDSLLITYLKIHLGIYLLIHLCALLILKHEVKRGKFFLIFCRSKH